MYFHFTSCDIKTSVRGTAVSQDHSSGAAANKWGRETARQIASRIGAAMLTLRSNEASLDGQRVVIKCAARATGSVRVTFKILGTVDAVIAAFQLDDGSFELWSLPRDVFCAEMRGTRSRGASAGKVGKVHRSVFSRRGTFLRRLRAD
jgi:hypothetical protein